MSLNELVRCRGCGEYMRPWSVPVVDNGPLCWSCISRRRHEARQQVATAMPPPAPQTPHYRGYSSGEQPLRQYVFPVGNANGNVYVNARTLADLNAWGEAPGNEPQHNALSVSVEWVEAVLDALELDPSAKAFAMRCIQSGGIPVRVVATERAAAISRAINPEPRRRLRIEEEAQEGA